MATSDRAPDSTLPGDTLSPEPGALSTLPLEDIGLDEAEEARHQKKKLGVLFYFSLAWIVIVLICAIFADFLPVRDPNAIDIPNRRSSPLNGGFLLGSDNLGRDVLSRTVHGARVSTVISVSAVLTGMIIGGTLGLASGYLRGRFESLVMGAVNTLLAFPGLILLLTLVTLWGSNLVSVTSAVAFLSIPIYTRVARATTLAVSQREYVLAAKALGAKKGRILFREIAPNVALPVMAFGLIALGTVIILEGTLAFLGLSVQRPQATWGTMIYEARPWVTQGVYYLTVIPALVLFFTVFSLNYVGDALRNRFDVREAQL